ncbi:unnamed protein product [Camellia sinensis]
MRHLSLSRKILASLWLCPTLGGLGAGSLFDRQRCGHISLVRNSLNSMSARNESQKQFGSYDNKQTHVRTQKVARMPSGATVDAAIVKAENSLETDVWGAMENKSLNIFNSKLVLASPKIATDADYATIFGVIGHELTCQDWLQFSLKEGLIVFRD